MEPRFSGLMKYGIQSRGEWAPTKAMPVRGKYTGGGIFLRPDGSFGTQGEWWEGEATGMDKIGKKFAGRLLDNEPWDQYPNGGIQK